MEKKQSYKYKGQDGELLDGEMTLDFRALDRCRKSDAPLFYDALGLLDVTNGDAGFSVQKLAEMDSKFIDALVSQDGNFDKIAFGRLKADMIAVYELNMWLFENTIAPFFSNNFTPKA